PQSFCGRRIGLTAGLYEYRALRGESRKCAKAGREPIRLETYDSDGTVRQALLSGRVDALVDGLTATPYMVKHNADKFELVGKLPIGADPLGMPFAHGRDDLVRAFQQAWTDLLESEEYARLAKKWELDALVPDEITVNSGEGL